MKRGFRIRAFAVAHGGTTAVEFGFLALPFLMVLLGALQIGIIYLTKSTLHSATLKVADDILAVHFDPLPTADSIRKALCARSANLFDCDGNLKVEIKPLDQLTAGVVGLSDGLVNLGVPPSVLVLRTELSFTYFVPGLGSTGSIHAAAVLRRPVRPPPVFTRRAPPP